MADYVDLYKPNRTNITRLSKSRVVSSDAINQVPFDNNRKKFNKYLKAKNEFYQAHDEMILLLYEILAKYEGQGFSSSDFLAMMGYSKRGTAKEDWNLATLLQTIGRLDLNSDQFTEYLYNLLGNSNITTEDSTRILEALNKYDKAYATFRPLDLQNYKDQQKNASFLRSETDRFNTNGEGTLEQKFLYAITTAEKDLTGSVHANVYFLESSQMSQFLTDEMYFGIHNIVDKYGLLTYTRFGAKAAFTPSVLETQFNGSTETNKNIMKDYFNQNADEGMAELIKFINDKYQHLTQIGDTHYGRGAEAGARQYFSGQEIPVQLGENQLGLREGDIIIPFNGKEIHLSVKNIKDFGSQQYDEFKERAPEDMAYMFSNKKFFIQKFGDATTQSAQQQDMLLGKAENQIMDAISQDEELPVQLYEQSGFREQIIEILGGI